VLALAEHADADVPAAIAGPSSSMLLGMWTTAATFYGLMFVDFPSLQQLGRLLGHSMMACGILTLVMVPALLPRRPPRRAVPALLMPRLAEWIVRRRRPVLAATVVLTCILGVAATRIRMCTSCWLRDHRSSGCSKQTSASRAGSPPSSREWPCSRRHGCSRPLRLRL
jgi:predicted RND superfamily exporter protein